MGARGRDRGTGRTLPSGWGGQDAPSDLRTPGAPAVPDPSGADGNDRGSGSGSDGPARRGRRLLAVLAVLVLVGGLLLALPRLLGAGHGPEQVAGEFLQAVVDGDLETVRSHARDDAEASTAALTAEILAGAQNRPASFEIQQVTVEAGTATVTAALRTGTGREAVALTLSAHDAGPLSPVEWELDPVELPELRIDLSFGVSEIEIEGVTFAVDDIQVRRETYEPQVAVQLLPGTYDVRVPEVPHGVEPPQRALEVPAALEGDRVPVHDLRLRLDEDGREEMRTQVDAALEDCLASTSGAPEGCPFAVTEPGEDAAGTGSGTWSLPAPPDLESRSVSAFLWVFDGDGAAQFTPADGAAPIVVPFTVQGTAAITDQGTLEVHLRSAGEVSYGYCVDAETGTVTGAVATDENGKVLGTDCG